MMQKTHLQENTFHKHFDYLSANQNVSLYVARTVYCKRLILNFVSYLRLYQISNIARF